MSRTPFTTEKVLWHLLRGGKLPPASSKRSVTPYEDYWYNNEIELPFEEGSVVKVVIELANPGENPTTELNAWKCSWIEKERQGSYIRVKAKWDNITENLV